MSGSPGRGTMTRAGIGYADSRRRWSRKASTAAILVVGRVGDGRLFLWNRTPIFRPLRPKPKPPTTSSTANPKLPAGTASTQQRVLNAWLAADQTLYAYMDEPPAPLRADLVAGQTTADLFPKLADYYVNPALQSEGIFLIKLKTQLLNGPTTLQPRESYRHCPNRNHGDCGILHLRYRHHNGHRQARPTHA